MKLHLKKICRQVCFLSEEVGKFIQRQRNKISAEHIEVKGIHDFVTYVDKESERRLVKGLQKILPEAGFITEEETISNERKKYSWIIDPLDGTTNFIHGVPCYCISIALVDFRSFPLVDENGGDGEAVPLLGVIYEPNFSEMFCATKNGGAFLNGKKISVSKTKKLNDSLLVTGFPTYNYSRMNEYIELFRYFMKHTHGLRRMGSAAVDLAYVACGRVDAFYEYNLNSWDVAAGALIVKESGGQVTDFNGKNKFLFGKEIIASNTKTHKEFVKTVKQFFK
ncbi:MAG: inositol monophosphatase family protein [Bacteroidota bacterium]